MGVAHRGRIVILRCVRFPSSFTSEVCTWFGRQVALLRWRSWVCSDAQSGPRMTGTLLWLVTRTSWIPRRSGHSWSPWRPGSRPTLSGSGATGLVPRRRTQSPGWTACGPTPRRLFSGLGSVYNRGMSSDHVAVSVALAGEVLQIAPRHTMPAPSAPSLAQEPAWVAHWMSAARTVSRRGDLRAIRPALLRVPEHRELCHEGTGTLLSEAAYAEAFRSVVHNSLFAGAPGRLGERQLRAG